MALEAQKKLKEINIDSKVISMPCQELFDLQKDDYKNKILKKNIPIISIEAGSKSSWKKYTKNNIGIEVFGESAPYKEVYNHLNITSDKIVELTKKVIKN